ncbi:MFS transporter [Streptomyces sp. NBC_01142]|uniref:MFS transporter n=1 Tax=Streptomyces sp. NBC_01142 TaxID=2975865 RepID=UPI00225A5EAA|nr:MFS transporter [Streptomyces sp. NBC_01142]MCX4823018.1 MFS transporter [Streptomyces sp. NBC_01142]
MTTTSPETPLLSKAPGTDNGPRLLLAVVLAAQFMALLDTFIVNVAAPTIRTELDASGAGLQLVIAGYTIAYAVLLITGARLGDLLGHRRAYLGGLLLFTAASLACGLAVGTGQLIAFRLVQGAGAALMIPQVLSLIQRNFTGEGRVRALGAYSAVLATGAAAGQVVGGVLVSADLFGASWRPVFLVNVPIGAALLVLGARVLPKDRRDEPERARGLDLPGLVLLAAAVSLFTVPLVLGQEQDWPLWSWLSLAVSTALFGLFLAYESRLAGRGGAPLIAPRVLRIPGMGRAVLRIAVVMAVNAGFLFVLTLHVQGSLGYSALRAGLMFAPTALVFGAVGLTWRRWPAGLQKMLVAGGFTLTALGSAAVGAVLRDGGDGGPWMYVAFVAVGVGLSLAFSPTLTGALATVEPQDAADASGLLVTVTQLGQVIGVAVFGTLFLNRQTVPGAQGSADALWVCALALAAASILGAVAGLVHKRR